MEKMELMVGNAELPAGKTTTVSVHMEYLGGCCYNETIKDLVCTLELPDGLTLTSGDNPFTIDLMVVPGFGVVTYVNHTWEVQASSSPSGKEIKVVLDRTDANQIVKAYTFGAVASDDDTTDDDQSDVDPSDDDDGDDSGYNEVVSVAIVLLIVVGMFYARKGSRPRP